MSVNTVNKEDLRLVKKVLNCNSALKKQIISLYGLNITAASYF